MTNTEAKSSDDEMIDIQIEESLVRESLMSIDASNFKEDVMNLLGFAAILGLMMLVGICGPPAIFSHSVTQPFAEILSLEAKEITSDFRFVDYEMTFTRNSNEKLNEQIQFQTNLQYKIFAYDKAGKIKHQFHMAFGNKSVVIKPQSLSSDHFRIYRDRIIDFSSIAFDIVFLNSQDIINKFGQDQINVTISVLYGSKEHTMFQIYFRFIFSGFVIFFLYSMVKHLYPTPVKLWHLEQKLTVPLLALCILYNDPFYIFQAKSPTYVYILWNTISTSIFTAYFQFFILVLFDSLRYKNRKTDRFFFFPKITFCIILFLSSVIHGIYDDISSFHGAATENYDSIEEILRWTQIMLNIFYLVWAIISIALAGIQIDIIERYKFYMYVATGGTSLFVFAIVRVLFNAFKLFQNSAIHFVMIFSIQNSFVLMMMYFHWPYEVINDQTYADETEKENAAIKPSEFFANEQPVNDQLL